MASESSTGWVKTAVVSAVLLAAAAGAAFLIFSTEPTAARGGATKRTEMLVDVTRPERGTFRPLIVATGEVQAEQDIVVSPRVGGQIVWRAPVFTPGGFVQEGDVILRIDPADYRNVLQQRQSDLRQALTELDLEMGRQNVAQGELRLFEGDLSEEERARVLRQPQREAAEVRVDAARAALDQARLDLRRTRIEAPFSGQVLTRNVNVGSQVSPGDPLGRLVGLDSYWVVVTVSRSKLRWLSFPEGGEPQGGRERGAAVEVYNRGAWPEGVTRQGHLDRLLGALDGQTRMARLIVTVPDPLARGEETPDGAPVLMIGDFLETRIEGKPIPDAIRLERAYLREGDTVWVMAEGALDIREVEVVARDERFAYIAGGLTEEDRVVTTNLATVTEGAGLRLRSEPPAVDADPGIRRE